MTAINPVGNAYEYAMIHPNGNEKRQDTRVTELERKSQIRPPLTHMSEGNQVDTHGGASESAAISPR